MIKKRLFILFFFTFCLCNTNVYSQREISLEKEDNSAKENVEIDFKETNAQQNIQVYSIFNDYRIPVRENVNTSNLRYDGWVTDTGMYTFRCRNGKRIRLTHWYLSNGPKNAVGSEFINITPALSECQKNDIEYLRRN